MPIKSWMSLIMGQIKPEHPELFALEFGKISESDFFYTLASQGSTLRHVRMTLSSKPSVWASRDCVELARMV